MVRTIKLDATAIKNFYLQNAIDGIDKALQLREEEMKQIAPTDTGDYIRSFKIKEASVSGDYVEGSNVNDSDHAFGVEFGFRSNAVNRHKGPPRNSSTRIYTGVGARVMTRVVEETADTVKNLIIKSINKGI